MDYSRLIHEYLDEQLSPILEDKLFAEMAINQDVRAEFGSQLRLNKFTQLDMEAIEIPSDSTEAVFAELGFSIPSSGLPNVGFRYYWSWLKRNGVRTASALLLLMLLLIGGAEFINTNKSIDTVSNKSSYPVVSSQSTDLVSIESNSSDIARNTFASNKINRERINPVSTEKYSNIIPQHARSADSEMINTQIRVDNIDDTPAIEQNSDNSSIQALFNHSNLDFAYSGYNNSHLTSNEYSLQAIAPSFLDFVDMEYLNFDIIWTKSNNQYGNALALPSDDRSFFHGNNLTLLYRINDEHSVGVCIGEEEFYQEFTYHNGEQLATYKQMPNYLWAGVAYKYSPQTLRLMDNVQPYSKITAGGAKGGLLAKGELGVNVQITPTISVYGAGEYGAMIFNIREQMYYSDKFRLLYGISLSL